MDEVSRYMQKISKKNFPSKKVFHIYLKDRCVSHSLSQKQFENNWQLLNNLVSILTTNYSVEDLSYEEVEYKREDSEGSY